MNLIRFLIFFGTFLPVASGCDRLKERGVPRGAYRHVATVPEVELIGECRDRCATIVLDSTLTIGQPSDSVLLHENSLLVTSGGLLSARFGSEPGRPPLFDAETGQFLKSVGRWGRGPGEFIEPYPFPGLDNQIWLFDPGNTRITVISDSGMIERQFPFYARPFTLVPLDSLRVVMSGMIETGGEQRLSIHVFGPYGNHLQSFGPSFGRDYHGYPKLDVAPDGTIWFAHGNSYTLEQWSAEGRLLRILNRPVAWFEPWHAADYSRHTTIDWFQVDPESGLLWVGMSLPDPDAPPKTHWEGRRITMAVKDTMRDMRIEVIDPKTLRVIARRDFDRPRVHAIPPSSLMQWPVEFGDGRAGFVIAERKIALP